MANLFALNSNSCSIGSVVSSFQWNKLVNIGWWYNLTFFMKILTGSQTNPAVKYVNVINIKGYVPMNYIYCQLICQNIVQHEHKVQMID